MTTHSADRIAAMLLAAGGSSRLGRPKQLLEIEGETLISRSARQLMDAAFDPIIVVLGAEADACRSEIADLKIRIALNAEWQAGMSSSIRTGIEALLAFEPAAAAVLVALCDQPRISAWHLAGLLAAFRSGTAPTIAARYDGILGVPAIFSREFFPDLSNLTGDRGAKEILRNTPSVASFDLPEAAFDIDTPADTNS